MQHNHPSDLLAAYALGCLEADEHAMVDRHLQDCRKCRQTLVTYEEVSDQLVFGAPAQTPANHIKARLMATIKTPPKDVTWLRKLMVSRPPVFGAAVAAALVLVCVLVLSNILLWRQLNMERGTDGPDRMRLVWLQASDLSSSAHGAVIVGRQKKRALLIVRDLPPLAPAYQYQLWLIKNGKRTNGGVFSVSEDGRGKLIIEIDQPIVNFDALGITIEPSGGSPGPTGNKVLGGKVTL